MRAPYFVSIGLAAGVCAAAQEPPAKAKALPLDVTRLVPHKDSFAVRVQGIQIGYIRNTLEALPAGFRYTEQSSIAGLVDQTTTLELDAFGAMKSVRQLGTVQGQNASIEVDYSGGRVRGSATTAGADGPKAVVIDTTVPAGTLDDNAIQSILPALTLAPGALWSVGVFTAAANEYRVTSLKVIGTEKLPSDPAAIDTYKIEWSGVVQPTTFWVTTEAPHRIVRIAIAGAPVEIVRVNGK